MRRFMHLFGFESDQEFDLITVSICPPKEKLTVDRRTLAIMIFGNIAAVTV